MEQAQSPEFKLHLTLATADSWPDTIHLWQHSVAHTQEEMREQA